MSTMRARLSAKSKQHNQNKPFTNALKHGAFSGMAILPGEMEAEFQRLRLSLIGEWNPIGPTEEDAVLDIAKGLWRKARLQKFLRAKVEGCGLDPKHILYHYYYPSIVLQHMDLIEHSLRVDDVRGFIDFLTKEDREHLNEKCPRENFDSVAEWIAAIKEQLFTVLLPRFSARLTAVEYTHWVGASAEFFSPDVWRDELSTEDRINLQIDRAIKRLIQLKAFKQMLDQVPRQGDS
jgi:hypothetical protein